MKKKANLRLINCKSFIKSKRTFRYEYYISGLMEISLIAFFGQKSKTKLC